MAIKKTPKSKQTTKVPTKAKSRTGKAATPQRGAKSRSKGAKRVSAKPRTLEEQLLERIAKDSEKLLEDFIQKQYEALSDFASDIVVITAKRLLEINRRGTS
jgi:hypothetical protein